jgi:ABC-2 type transport system permease protein
MKAGLGGMLRSEWTKLRSVRSTFWSLATMVVITLGLMSIIVGSEVAHWTTLDEGSRAELASDPLQTILTRPFLICQLVVAVLGVMVVSAEYTTGMIRSTLQAQPRRLTMLTAKVLVFGAVMLVIGEALSFAAFFLGKAWLSPRVSIGLDDPGVLRTVIGSGLYLTVLGLFALATGSIIRYTAGAVTAVIGTVLIVSQLVGLLPGTWGKYIAQYFPTNAGSLVYETKLGADALLTQWQGLAVFTGWTVLLLLVAGYLLRRRDA